MAKKENTALNKLLHKYASRHVIEQSSSAVNKVLEVVKIGDRLLLNSANTNYSFGGLHRVFQKVFKKIDLPARQLQDVLILGFGTGSIVSILREELGMVCDIVAVEKDPEVIRLGKKYFNTLRYSGIKLIEADAAEYVANATQSFDLIIVDVYVDFEVPELLEQQEFIDNLSHRINPGGMVIFNKLIYNHKARQEAEELQKKFNLLPGETQLLKVRENVKNRVIIYEPVTSSQ
jgi:spermidine synthase